MYLPLQIDMYVYREKNFVKCECIKFYDMKLAYKANVLQRKV
jgi:hypothetical protein